MNEDLEKFTITYESSALDALEDIAFYFALEGEYEVGSDIVLKIKENIKALQTMPNRCPVSAFSQKIRKLSVINLPYIAYYTVERNGIYVLEVMHGSRNQDFLFEKYKGF